MPTLRVELFAGRTPDQKAALAQALTEATVKTLGCGAEAVEILFFDIQKHDWASAGVLWSAPRPAAG